MNSGKFIADVRTVMKSESLLGCSPLIWGKRSSQNVLLNRSCFMDCCSMTLCKSNILIKIINM